jgi:Fe-S-cluster-containing dehydrogenase component
MKKSASDMSELSVEARRKFLKQILSGTATVLFVYTPGALGGHETSRIWKQRSKEHQWAYIIDPDKCIGWGGCVRACKRENNVPDGVFRTWVERYVVNDEGVYVDSPDGALNGFEQVNAEFREKPNYARFIPKMCNHCENPPCVQVCPVGATFKSPEGFVLVDPEHCLGCAYCVQACPYGARFINPETRKSDKCSWCYHRVKRGKLPACVEACPTGARKFGDLKDPESEVSKILRQGHWTVLKPGMHTGPACYYIGLPQEVV